MDSLVLEKTSHPSLQIAPFLLVVALDDTDESDLKITVTVEPCHPNSNDWLPINTSAIAFGVFGTCPWLDEHDDVQTHTVGFFANNPSLTTNDTITELTIYIIDGRHRDLIDNEVYVQSRNAAVNMFKSRVLQLPFSTPHSEVIAGFSPLPTNDRINSALHVRHCFRELAGSLLSPDNPFGRNGAESFRSFSWNNNAFHDASMFKGVRVQIAQRCWTMDLEDATVCVLKGDYDLLQYAGGYGKAVTTPLTDEEGDIETQQAKQLLASRCANALCGKLVSSTRYVLSSNNH